MPTGTLTLVAITRIRRPPGLKTKAVLGLLLPPCAVTAPSVPESGGTALDPDTGVIEAIVAVTGVVDDVGDEIQPGALRRSLRTRAPAMCLGRIEQGGRQGHRGRGGRGGRGADAR